MSLAHVTLATRDVERTASFFERTFGFRRRAIPDNSPAETQWLETGRGQQLHVVYVEGFATSPFEGEFGRHVALYAPRLGFSALKQRLVDEGATIVAPLRATSFERFFVREPINGYVLEVIATADPDFSGSGR